MHFPRGVEGNYRGDIKADLNRPDRRAVGFRWLGTICGAMGSYKAKLKSREIIAEGTMAFHFEKPAGFTFKAGQFMRVTLIEPSETDAEGARRFFTIASAPYETDIIVATRMRDTAFKRVLKTMELNTEVEIDGPFGSLVLHDDPARPAVFLTGGIGVTPFRSIILQATRDKTPHRLFLFYSNRRPEDAAFLKELAETEDRNPNYKLVATMTEMQKSQATWQGETGLISRAMLAEYIDDLSSPIYYIAGPPGMVDAMQTMLNDAGIDRMSVRVEEFSGYE